MVAVEEPSLVVNTLDDDSYEGGTLSDELADGGGLSLREAIGLINDGTVSETLITFDQNIADESNQDQQRSDSYRRHGH